MRAVPTAAARAAADRGGAALSAGGARCFRSDRRRDRAARRGERERHLDGQRGAVVRGQVAGAAPRPFSGRPSRTSICRISAVLASRRFRARGRRRRHPHGTRELSGAAGRPAVRRDDDAGVRSGAARGQPSAAPAGGPSPPRPAARRRLHRVAALAGARRGRERRRAARADLHRRGMVVQAAAEGQGVALARSALAAGDLAAGRLVQPFDVSIPYDLAYYLVCPEATARAPEDRRRSASWLLAEAAVPAARQNAGRRLDPAAGQRLPAARPSSSSSRAASR